MVPIHMFHIVLLVKSFKSPSNQITIFVGSIIMKSTCLLVKPWKITIFPGEILEIHHFLLVQSPSIHHFPMGFPWKTNGFHSSPSATFEGGQGFHGQVEASHRALQQLLVPRWGGHPNKITCLYTVCIYLGKL